MNTARYTGSARCRVRLPIRFGMSLVLLLSVTGAHAETLFKCQGGDGVASYQSAPCAEPAQQVWQREVTPEPESEAPRNRASSPARTVTRTRAVARAAAPRANACARARAAADDERDRRWYTITFDRLRELDEQVARACKRA